MPGPNRDPAHLIWRAASLVLAAPAADRPGANALALQHVVGHANLLLAARVVGRPRSTVGPPGAHGELQASVVTIAGGGVPVATRLACCDGVPVHAAVRIR